MNLRFIIPLLLVAFSGIYCGAKSLDQTAFDILINSPEFRAQTYSLEGTMANLKTESNLPDPELSGEYLVMPQDVDNRWTVQLEWGLEWPGVYKSRSNEAKSKLTVAQKETLALRAERLAEIKDLLLDYIRSQQKLIILQELSNNNDTIYQLALQASRGGEMTVLDLNKVKLEYANIRVAMAAILDEKAEVVTNISRIYGADCSNLLQNLDCRFPDIILPSYQEIENIKLKAPAIQSALAEAESARLAKKTAKMEALPSISFGYKHAFEDAMHFNGGVLGISIPIFSSRGKQKAAKADILAAETKAEATSLEIESEAINTLKRIELINSQIKEIAPIIEDADYNSALLKAYKAGVITLIEYISDRNYFTSAAVELVSLRHNAAKALAFLQRFSSPLPDFSN